MRFSSDTISICRVDLFADVGVGGVVEATGVELGVPDMPGVTLGICERIVVGSGVLLGADEFVGITDGVRLAGGSEMLGLIASEIVCEIGGCG